MRSIGQILTDWKRLLVLLERYDVILIPEDIRSTWVRAAVAHGHLNYNIARIERCKGGWAVSDMYGNEKLTSCFGRPTLHEEIPADYAASLAVLLTAPVGFFHKGIGRRVSEDVFWIYVRNRATQTNKETE